MDEAKVSELLDVFRELADTAGGYERTRIMPNLEVIDTAPSGLPANFIIIKDDEGFYIPALRVAGMTYTNGDLVNVLFIKGAEPIAFQHGSSGSGGYAVHISDEGVDQGVASELDFVGAGVTAAVATGVATITVSATGGAWPTAGQNLLNTTNYATVALLIAAMSAGQIGMLGSRSSNEAVNVNVNVITLRGVGNSAIIFTATFTTVSDCVIRDIGVEIASTADARGFNCTSNVLTLVDCRAVTSGTTTSRALQAINAFTTIYVYGGTFEGNGVGAYDVYADAGTFIYFVEPPVLVNGTIGGSGTVRGPWHDNLGQLHFATDSGHAHEVWLHDVAGEKKSRQANLAGAIANLDPYDIIVLDPGIYTGQWQIANESNNTLRGVASKQTELYYDVDGTYVLNVYNSPNIGIENIKIVNAGAGATSTCFVLSQLLTASDGLVLRNIIIEKTSGAATTSRGLVIQGGAVTGTLLESGKIIVTAGTTTYGVVVDVVGGILTIGPDVEINGTTADIRINHASAVVELRGCKLLGGGISLVAGTVRGWYIDAYGRIVRQKPIGINNVRLTLTTGTPVTTADVTAATTIYATPYKGNTIEVYTGSGWVEAPFAELSLSLSGFTANKNSDIFIYDNAGTLALERVEWTNDTTRATALAVQDGRYVKSGDATRLYLGTFRTTGTTGQCEDSAANRFVWNYYNRTNRGLRRYRSNSHTYDTFSYRAWDNDTANTQAQFVIGVVEDFIDVTIQGTCTMVAGGSTPYIAIGLNSTTVSSLGIAMGIAGTLWFGGDKSDLTPGVGYNYLQPLELGTATGADPTFWEVQIQTMLRG